MIGSPQLRRIAHTVYVRLAVRRGYTYRHVLERAAKAAHRMTLEVGQYQHGIVLGKVLAHEVLGKMHAIGYGQRHLAKLVHYVAGRDVRKAVIANRLPVILGIVAAAFIRRVALDDGARKLVNQRLNQCGIEEIVPARLHACS